MNWALFDLNNFLHGYLISKQLYKPNYIYEKSSQALTTKLKRISHIYLSFG